MSSNELVGSTFIAVQKILGEELKWEMLAEALDLDRVRVSACAGYFGLVGARSRWFDSFQKWAVGL